MNEPTLESNERISRRFLSLVTDMVKEMEHEGDAAGLDALPTVMVTTGIMAMCRIMGIETVATVLDALKIKVERGDFTNNFKPNASGNADNL